MIKRLRGCCSVALPVGLLSGCAHDTAPPPGPLIVRDDHGAILLSVGPLKDGKTNEPYFLSPGDDIMSGEGQKSYHTETGAMADTAQFDKTWAALTSSMKVAKTVPLAAGTDLRANTRNTKNYPTYTAR